MDNTAQWIPLSGPGGRLPTEDDGDNNGMVWFAVPNIRQALMRHWSFIGNATAFIPIPERPTPPLPKPVEKTQEEKDADSAWMIIGDGNFSERGSWYHLKATECIAYGRSDGRAQLAREALGLFDNSEALYQTANKLHALLTKAAGENK